MSRAVWIVVASLILLAGCASTGPEDEDGRATEPTSKSEKSVQPKPPPSPPRNEKTVRFGTVDSVRPVTLPGTDTGAGGLVGAVVGGIAGAEAGKGRGSAVGAVIGTVAGGLAGAALEDHLTRREALEIIVELDNSGELRAITQEPGAQAFQRGERVRLVTGGGVTRVEKLSQD